MVVPATASPPQISDEAFVRFSAAQAARQEACETSSVEALEQQRFDAQAKARARGMETEAFRTQYDLHRKRALDALKGMPSDRLALACQGASRDSVSDAYGRTLGDEG